MLPSNKDSAVELLERLKRTVLDQEAFEAFPEGDAGVIVYALLKVLQEDRPDAVDFGHELQGFHQIAAAASRLLLAELQP